MCEAALSSSGSHPIAVDTAPDNVGALETGDRAHMNAPLARDEILTLDEKQAEVACEIGLFEIGLAERTRGQQTQARLAALSAGGEAGTEAAKERGEPLDVQLPVETGDRTRDHQPIFERIAGSGGRLRSVAEHPPPPVRSAPDIHGV